MTFSATKSKNTVGDYIIECISRKNIAYIHKPSIAVVNKAGGLLYRSTTFPMTWHLAYNINMKLSLELHMSAYCL